LPAIEATAVPVLGELKYINALEVSTTCILWGIITSSLLSKIVNTGYKLFNSWLNDQVVEAVVWLSIAFEPDTDNTPPVEIIANPLWEISK